MSLLVIGAGFGRTGTFTLKLALERLGFGPCCHGFDERHFAQGTNFWRRAFEEKGPINWEEFFRGYNSTVDSPSCKFYLELAREYPQSKVVLTIRESKDWIESYEETVLPLIASSQGGRYFSFLFGTERPTRASMMAAYERHNAEVQRTISADRLLVYEVADGWRPLCQFLGVPIPDDPFPCSNSRSEFPSVIDSVLGRMAENNA